MWDCINPTRLYETNKNCPTITSIKKASQRDAFFIIRNYANYLINSKTKKTTHNSSSTRSQLASCTGNFETLGSKFRHETRRGCCRPSYYSVVLFKISFVIIVRFHVLAPIRSGIHLVYPHDYKCEHQSSHVALELS